MKTKHFTPIVALVLMTITFTAATWAQSYKEVINAEPPAVYPGSPFTADAAGNRHAGRQRRPVAMLFLRLRRHRSMEAWRSPAPHHALQLERHTDGAGPGGKVVFDAQGNAYGTAGYAGDLNACFQQGCGVVYKLSPTSSGFWTQTVLHTFEGGSDGITPLSVVVDANGNIFGLTRDGGGYSCSAVDSAVSSSNSLPLPAGL